MKARWCALEIEAPPALTSEETGLSAKDLREIYRLMRLGRSWDARCIILQRQGRIPIYASSAGQEATQVGSAYALGPEDWVQASYRESAAALARGLTLRTLADKCFGNATDLGKGRDIPPQFFDREKRWISPSAPVATQIPQTVGFAMAARMRGESLIVLAYFGEGSTSAGDFHSGLNFAGVFKPPCVFLCQNNQYAISVPLRRQTAATSVAEKAQAYGLEGVQVDGNDVLAVYNATRRAVYKARSGNGPTLIECVTYRLENHSTSDDWTRYRSPQEVEEWKRKDPILRFQSYLRGKGMLSEEEDKSLQAEIEQQIAEAVSGAEAAPAPSVESIFEDVYSQVPWNLREQMEEAKSSSTPGEND